MNERLKMIFISWIGKNDIEGIAVPRKRGLGSIISALKEYGKLFERVYLLNSYKTDEMEI